MQIDHVQTGRWFFVWGDEEEQYAYESEWAIYGGIKKIWMRQ